MRRSKFVLIFSIVGLILSLSCMTYAYLKTTTEQVKNNELTSLDCLSISLENEKNNISLSNAYPISDDEGKTLTPFKFSVKNNCNYNVVININLESLSVSNKIDNAYLKVYLTSASSSTLNKLSIYPTTTTTLSNAVSSSYLLEDKLYANSSIDYELRLWVDYDTTTTQGLNKAYNGKIVVSAKPKDKASITYLYTGNVQEFTAPYSGYYKIELWGAQGGASILDGGTRNVTDSRCLKVGTGTCDGGYGSYTSGEIYLNKDEKLYIYVGGKGTNGIAKSNAPGGYNGGGYGSWDNSDDEANGAGGGATDVRLVSGLWNDDDSLNSRIMVAAGGGGSSDTVSGLAGGGIQNSNVTILGYSATAFTTVNQTSGYKFGIGQDGILVRKNYPVAGGGGGYYGGYAQDTGSTFYNFGAGGSSYISGHTGCVAITSASNATAKSGCTTGTTSNACSTHYSGKTFKNTVMIDGLGYLWTNTKGAKIQMPKPDGESYALGVGNTGNGYAKITYIDYEREGLQLLYDATNNTGSGYNSSSAIWKDLSYNGNDATISGAVWSNNGLLFDGTDDYASIGILNNNTYTLEAVVKPTQNVTGYCNIIDNYEIGGYGLYIYSNNVIINQMYSKENSGYKKVFAQTKYISNQIYNITGTYDGNSLKIYINGNLENKVSVVGTIGVPDKNTIMMLGSNPWGTVAGGEYFPGYMYSIRLYSRALTDEEITYNYNLDKSRFNF